MDNFDSNRLLKINRALAKLETLMSISPKLVEALKIEGIHEDIIEAVKEIKELDVKSDIERAKIEVYSQQKVLEEKLDILLRSQTNLQKTVESSIDKDIPKVLGFSIVKSPANKNNNEYYHAVKRINNDEIRIYIGKKIDDNNIKTKICTWFSKHPERINFLGEIGELDNVLKFSQENNIDISFSN